MAAFVGLAGFVGFAALAAFVAFAPVRGFAILAVASAAGGGSAGSGRSAAADSVGRGHRGRGSHRGRGGGAARVPLRNGLEEEDRAGDGGIQRADRAAHRDAHEQVAAPSDRGAETLALAADDDGERTTQIALPRGQRRVGLGTGHAQSACVQVGERAREVVHRAEQEVLDGACRRLDCRWGERRLPVCREQHPVHARRFGAAQEGADVLWVLERIEGEHERRLATFRGPREDLVERREPAWGDDERDALMSVESGERGQRAALDLDDRDAEVRRVEHQLLERLAALRHDEEAMRLPTGHERLLDRSPPGDQFLLV